MTLRSTSLRALELPDIGTELRRGTASAKYDTELEQLLEELAKPKRDATLKTPKTGLWQTYEIMIRTIDQDAKDKESNKNLSKFESQDATASSQ